MSFFFCLYLTLYLTSKFMCVIFWLSDSPYSIAVSLSLTQTIFLYPFPSHTSSFTNISLPCTNHLSLSLTLMHFFLHFSQDSHPGCLFFHSLSFCYTHTFLSLSLSLHIKIVQVLFLVYITIKEGVPKSINK